MRHLRQGLDGWLQPPVKRYEPRSRAPSLPAQPAATAREQGRTAPADLQPLPADAPEDGLGSLSKATGAPGAPALPSARRARRVLAIFPTGGHKARRALTNARPGRQMAKSVAATQALHARFQVGRRRGRPPPGVVPTSWAKVKFARHQRSCYPASLSSQIVIGPSFTSSTFISAPKTPRATVTPSDSTAEAKR